MLLFRMASESERKIFSLDRSDFSLALAFFLLFTLLTPLGLYKADIPTKIQTGYYSVINPDKGDDAAYYSYLRSIFFDGDIDFYNEQGYAHSDKILPTGYVFNQWSIGPAVFWTPFFFLGHLCAYLLNISGLKVSLDGYSFPYYISTAVGSILFSFTGIYLLSKLLCRFYERKIAYFSSFIVFASTSLIYFTFIRQRMAHSLEFMLVVIFLFLFIKVREQNYNFKWMVLWGTSIGALIFTRYNDFTFLIIPALDFFYQLFINCKARTKINNILKGYVFFTASFIITIIPLFIVWKIISGNPYPLFRWVQNPSHFSHFSHFSYVFLFKKIFLYFFQGDLIKAVPKFFLGGDWGVLISEPIWLIALPGLWLFFKKNPFYGILFCVALYFPIYISATVRDEASFGHRYALSVNPILSFGVAAILSKINPSKVFFRILLIICCFFLIYKYLQLIQYKVILIYNDPQFTVHAIKNIPALLGKSEFWIRSSSIWKVISCIKQFKLLDFIFIVVFPLSIFFGMYSIIFAFNLSKKCEWSVNYGLLWVSLIVIFIYSAIISVYHIKSPEEKINRFFDVGLVHLGIGEPRKAVLDLERALQIDNKNIKILNVLGEIFRDFLANKKNGEIYFKKTLSISPNQQKINLKSLIIQKKSEFFLPTWKLPEPRV